MARVERRMYRRRRRTRRRWLCLLLIVVCAGVLLVWRKHPAALLAERLAEPTPTPVTAAYDQTIQTREITLAEESWYAIQTGVFSTREAAEEKAAAYSDRGAPGTVVQDGAKWRVFIACYGSAEEAAAVRQRLGEMQRVETYQYTWKCPELRLRLTGMAGQLDVVEAGLALMRQTAEVLRDTAILLDAGERTNAEAMQAVAALDGQITLWARTARERFGYQQPEIVQSLLSMTEDWNSRRKAIEAAAGSATDLSAALKGQGMQSYDAVIRMRAAIGMN